MIIVLITLLYIFIIANIALISILLCLLANM